MDDYIKREQVEEMLEKAKIISSPDGEYSGYCTEDICLESIPSADVVKERYAKWMIMSYQDWFNYRCSNCQYGVVGDTNYCPNCGANMGLED